MTKILEIMLTNMGLGYQDIEKLEFIKIFQNTPQLPPGQAPPRKGSCPGGRPSGPAAAAGDEWPPLSPLGRGMG